MRRTMNKKRRAEIMTASAIADFNFKCKLREINDTHAYVQFGYKTMDEYCRSTFFGHSYNYLIGMSNE